MQITNEDNIQLMARYPNNYFDLAIVDPPYAININMNMGRKKSSTSIPHTKKDWDNKPPDSAYFDELFRVSKHQIIWGGNYFKLPITKSWIFWDKFISKGVNYADGELAWTSFNHTLKKISIAYSGFIGADKTRIHPTQKPVRLYEWLLLNYAKPNDKVLDTHLGGGSIAIACHNLGFDLTACEIDSDYYPMTIERLKKHQEQLQFLV